MGAELAHALRDTHPIDLAMGLGRASQQRSSRRRPLPSIAATAADTAPGRSHAWTRHRRRHGSGPDRARSPTAAGAPLHRRPSDAGQLLARILLVAAVLAGVVAGALVVLLRT